MKKKHTTSEMALSPQRYTCLESRYGSWFKLGKGNECLIPQGGENNLLNNEIIDSLRLQSVSDSLSDEHRQHNRNNVSQGIGQLEHNNSQRDRRSLTTNTRSNLAKDTTKEQLLR